MSSLATKMNRLVKVDLGCVKVMMGRIGGHKAGSQSWGSFKDVGCTNWPGEAWVRGVGEELM